jgi:predicted transcriptional regulator of viral defense system
MRRPALIKAQHGASAQRQIIKLARRKGLLRARDLRPLDIPRRHLARMVAQGVLLRSGRGLYALADAAASEHRSLAEVGERVPAGVVCLLSALRFHGLTTQNPWEVWLAITPASRKPRIDHPPLHVARFSGPAFSEGVEHHRIDGVDVKIYSVAKTVADCFKYRNKIGIDVAVEALRDFSRKHRGGANELARYARICRVARVMQPYLDSIA